MTIKTEYISNVVNGQSGFDKEIERYYVGVSVFRMPDMTEFVAYITSTGVDVDQLQLLDYSIEFLNPITLDNVSQQYDAELFEEIYNVAFDELYRITEKEQVS
jgi:hypothetical protein